MLMGFVHISEIHGHGRKKMMSAIRKKG